MNKQEMSELYQDFIPMMAEKSRKFSNIYGIEYEEVLCQASLIFVETCKKYNGDKACFSTYLYHSLKQLNRYCQDYASFGTVEEFPINILYNMSTTRDNFTSLVEFDETIQNLSELARRIVHLAYEPFEMNLVGEKVTKSKIEKFLMSFDYTQKAIRNAFYEIQEAI